MNLKVESKIHNRFDIEVRDYKTGEIKQKGQAENIILNRMFTRLCNFNSYFNYIHFGRGEGVLDPSRNILFDEVGYKSAVTEETIKDFPISRWTRKIVINPEEYIGQSIKEVGISDTYSSTKSNSYINTHALIKDAEGNPLSIEKTDTDVVVIYATVFIELQNKSSRLLFVRMPHQNNLLNYLFGDMESLKNPSLILGELGHDMSGNLTMPFIGSSYPMSKQADVENKKVIFYKRLGITEGNGRIQELCLRDIIRVALPEFTVFSQHNLNNVKIGVGDGINKEFVTDTDLKNLNVYINNGLVDSKDYDSTSRYEYTKRILPISTILPFSYDIDSDIYNILRDETGYNSLGTNDKEFIMGVKEESLIGKKLWYVNETGSTSSSDRATISLYGSIDKINWSLLFSDRSNSKVEKLYEFIEDYKYLKLSITEITRYGARPRIGIYNDNYIGESKITFNTPPPEGATITADYTVPYIPKSEDYVLDVTAEIIFGEGV